MKVLKTGSVKIGAISLHKQSYPGSLFACIIYTRTLDVLYAKLCGEEKIIIHLSTDINGYNPTKISTGEWWKDYQYDDAISAFVKIKQLEVDIAFLTKVI